MKRSVWAGADIYGQLVVWILSVLPFVFFFSAVLKTSDFYLLLLVHGLGLLIVGIWQMASTLVNFFLSTGKHKAFFLKNGLMGVLLGLVFFCWVYSGNFKIPLPPGKIYYNYVLGIYFLCVDIAAIRYWKYIRNYYKQTQHA